MRGDQRQTSVFDDLEFEERLRAYKMLSPKSRRAKLADLERRERAKDDNVISVPVVLNRSAWDVMTEL